MRQSNSLLGPADWLSIGANGLNGKSAGNLLNFNESEQTINVMLMASLVSSPNGILFFAINKEATLDNAYWSLTNTQSLVVTMSTSNVLYWLLTNASGVPTNGGTMDFIRATAYR